jgi:hypothetical protein
VQLHDELNEFRRLGAEMAIVGNGSPEQADQFRREFGLRIRLFSDPEMSAYRAAGLRRSVARSLSWRALAPALRALRRGARPAALGGDPWQLGGAFLILPHGDVAFEFSSGYNGHHPQPEELKEALRRSWQAEPERAAS